MPAFSPIVGDLPHTLILGSMPSQQSLQRQEYYGNPRNSFWWIMAQLNHWPESLKYAHKVECLQKSGFAVWDILYDCIRPGSLDSAILRSSEEPNDIGEFLDLHPSIKLIAFNGGTSKSIFMRHCKIVFDLNKGLRWVQLPSTSPAYASMNRKEKLTVWRNEVMQKL